MIELLLTFVVGKLYSVPHPGGVAHGTLMSAKIEGSDLILEIKSPSQSVTAVKIPLPRKL